MLKARAVKSNPTIAEAKRRLVELGFLDVVQTGTVHQAGVFKVSDSVCRQRKWEFWVAELAESFSPRSWSWGVSV